MLGTTSQRSKNLTTNIIRSAIYKLANIVFNFLIVREAIAFFGTEKYGIWLTILAFFTWFSALEVGVSSSLRNFITKHFADGKLAPIKLIIAKGYHALTYIYISLIALFILALLLTPLKNIFITDELGEGLTFILIISSTLYFLHFIFFYLHSVLLATHYARTTYLIVAIQNAILLLGIVVFRQLELKPTLLLICVWFSCIPFIVWLVSNAVCYASFFDQIRPKFKSISILASNPFKGLNKSYFFIQISILVIFSTDNIIIINYLNETAVSIYQIVFKYFNILLVIFNLFIVPYWASFTESHHKNDKKWIIENFKKLIYIWIGITCLGILLLFYFQEAINLWIGEPLNIHYNLALFMLISMLLNSWNSIFSYFLNAIIKVRIQMTILIIMALIKVPLSIYLIEPFNSSGVIIATCIVLFPLSIALPFQCRHELKKMSAN